MSQTKIIKKLILDMTNIPVDKRQQAKKDVGEFVINETLRYVAQGKSPVKNLRDFKILNKEYAEKEKQGQRTPNLNLEGDMLEATKYKPKSYGVDIGIVDKNSTENAKADGHNQFSPKAKAWAVKTGMPKRRYIPDDKQEYKPKIMQGINKILDDYRVNENKPAYSVNENYSGDDGVDVTLQSITIQDILNGDYE